MAIVESPLCNRCRECSCIDFVNFKDLMDMDEDVIEEEERVHRMNAEAEYRFRTDSMVNSFVSSHRNEDNDEADSQ